MLVHRRLRLCYNCYRLIQRQLIHSQTQPDTAKEQKCEINAASKSWEPVIGLEIHAQILSASKLFSGAGTEFAARTNHQVSWFDAAMPGTLPVLNRRCVEAGVLTALALKSKINLVSWFDRKHYFYADLPAGYQITQQRCPLAVGGHLVYPCPVGNSLVLKKANITQIQLEQDSGKSLHDENDGYSLIDLNRAGVGLMEIVTEPDFRSAEEAAEFVKELRKVMRILQTCDGKMDEGSFRVDASVSLRRSGEAYGVRAEVKNLNSLRFVRKAIAFEIQRQQVILNAGGTVDNETRQFDINTGKTYALRDKEKVHDYRFMPEPNLLPLTLHTDASSTGNSEHVNVDEMRRRLPCLPEQERERLIKTYGISLDKAVLIMNQPGLMELFEELMKVKTRSMPPVLNFLINDLLGFLNMEEITLEDWNVEAEHIGEVVDMLADKAISLTVAKKVLASLYEGYKGTPRQLVEDQQWTQIRDTSILTEMCRKVVSENPKAANRARKGKKASFSQLVKGVMKMSGDRAEPKQCVQLINQLLKEDQ